MLLSDKRILEELAQVATLSLSRLINGTWEPIRTIVVSENGTFKAMPILK